MKGRISTHHLAPFARTKKGVIMDRILHRAAMVPNMHLIPLEKYDPVHHYEKMFDKVKQRKDFVVIVIICFI